MRGMRDRSICRQDPDRVGTGSHAHSTAGYSSPRVLRSRTGTRFGTESLLYTGTAPHGFKSVARRAVAQRLLERDGRKRLQATRGFSVQGEEDRRIYNGRPKWLLAGKMDLHKRDLQNGPAQAGLALTTRIAGPDQSATSESDVS